MGAMRWDALTVSADEASSGRVPLLPRGAVTRRFDTPEFRDVTFYEVQCRTALNRVPEASRVPFRWTINPYRGCTHACVYCFARKTHEYLDLDSGSDFDSRIVVKTNVEEVLRRELRRPSWQGESVAMGTNVDCYQRAEGRYRLMPGILAALTEVANPLSILTKGALILRDLDLIVAAADRADVSTAVSVGFLDEEAWRLAEPGTPPPARRLQVCATLNEAGVDCGVLMAPILPWLTDGPAELERTVRAIAEAGATHVSPIVLHLRPGAREWWFAWLHREHPALVERYTQLYRGGSYADAAYQRRITDQVRELAGRYGVGRTARPRRRTAPRRWSPERDTVGHGARPVPAVHEQMSLL